MTYSKKENNQKPGVLSEKVKEQFQVLENEMNIHFQNKDLLYQAFTHSSYVNEHRRKLFTDNERLEFLGDAVLELSVSKYLFEKFPNMSEGELTKLRATIACDSSLVVFANDLQFLHLFLLVKGEEL